MSAETVQIIARINDLLQAIEPKSQNEEYKKIVKDVKEYLSKFCNHRIIQDYIDNDVEYCTVIHYCVTCSETFSDMT